MSIRVPSTTRTLLLPRRRRCHMFTRRSLDLLVVLLLAACGTEATASEKNCPGGTSTKGSEPPSGSPMKRQMKVAASARVTGSFGAKMPGALPVVICSFAIQMTGV